MNTYLIALLALVSVAAVSANVHCYQCISTEHSKCDSSEESDLASFKKTCPKLTEGTFKGNDAVGCRKVVQRVEEDPVVVIRECAYSGAPVDGQKKTGNWAVSKTYYQCENEKPSEPCNGSSSIIFSAVALLIAVFFH